MRIRHSTVYTVTQAASATVSRLFSLKERSRATAVPAAAEYTDAVDVKTAGKVIAARTAKGI